MISSKFWHGKRVLITGHTGFKGSWLSIWLTKLGAKVSGFSLPPKTTPSMFEICCINENMHSFYGDITDVRALEKTFEMVQPEIVIHMAAQTLVKYSYENPIETYKTNVIGLVNLFETIRNHSSVKAVLNVTSDKCYQNNEQARGFVESDPMGGNDPYSCSKGCAELITASYRASFFDNVSIGSARAGNVIGGGDWAEYRLIPDIINSIFSQEKLNIRSPQSIRPWQHVLEPLSGYILLSQKLYDGQKKFCEGWNFGPSPQDCLSVKEIVDTLVKLYPGICRYVIKENNREVKEAQYLMLDSSKAIQGLGWKARWSIETALNKTLSWYQANAKNENMYEKSLTQINEYMQSEDTLNE